MRAPYWPYYCEENIWHRCKPVPSTAVEQAAVVITNARRSVALWNQRAAVQGAPFVVWDYHVVLFERAGGKWRVDDPDSALEMPAPAIDYLDATFPESALLTQFRPRFRMVTAELYRSELCSDRSHMRDDGGEWRAPPPPWPAIGAGSNLDRFLDLERTFLGTVLELSELRALVVGGGHAPAQP